MAVEDENPVTPETPGNTTPVVDNAPDQPQGTTTAIQSDTNTQNDNDKTDVFDIKDLMLADSDDDLVDNPDDAENEASKPPTPPTAPTAPTPPPESAETSADNTPSTDDDDPLKPTTPATPEPSVSEDTNTEPTSNFDKGLQKTQQDLGNLERKLTEGMAELKAMLSSGGQPATPPATQATPAPPVPTSNDQQTQTDKAATDLTALLDGRDDDDFINVSQLKNILGNLQQQPASPQVTQDPALATKLEEVQQQLKDLNEQSQQATHEQNVQAYWHKFGTDHTSVALTGEDPVDVGKRLLDQAAKHVEAEYPQYQGEAKDAALEMAFDQLVTHREKFVKGKATETDALPATTSSTTAKGKTTQSKKASRAVQTPGASRSQPGAIPDDDGEFDLRRLIK